MTRLICWNIAHRHAAWRSLVGADADIALLQEVREPPEDLAGLLEVDPAPFSDAGGKSLSRCAILKLSEGIKVEWLEPVPIARSKPGDLIESHRGCIAAAIITPIDGLSFTVVTFCPDFEQPHRSTGIKSQNLVDTSIHRVISDISLLIRRTSGHRIVVAGDLTITYGYGSNDYWRQREATIFDRMCALGLPLVGPQYPHGRQADPWPDGLPQESKNVPTYYHTSQNPATAIRQLDYVFASESMIDSIKVRALNNPEEWGPSDHCRIEIEVD